MYFPSDCPTDDMPKRAQKIIQLAKEHGWEVYHEGVKEGDAFGCPTTFELCIERWIGDREALWTLKWEKPAGGRWKSTERTLGPMINEYDENDVCVDSVYDSGSERHFRALTHVEHWLARLDEVATWKWLTGDEAG